MTKKGENVKKQYVDFAPQGPSTTGKEQVLCFPATIAHFGGFSGRRMLTAPAEIPALLSDVFKPDVLSFIDRDYAELDPSWLQLIPYVVLFRGREVFRYQRTKKGGEGRLHGLWSVGVGGHVNPEDSGLSADTPGLNPYLHGLRRELREEVGHDLRVDPAGLSLVQGLIFDPSDEVGRVHFGLVHFVQLGNNPTLSFADDAMAGGHFQHAAELRHSARDEFESWSRLVIEMLLT